MPKTTFINLREPKKKQIIDAFLREFATRTFDEASLTVVVKQLGIAKGSVYQYFEDKLDLFMFLIQECSTVKMKYVNSIKRDDYPDYWAYFRVLYEKGFQFDNENPLQSHFLHNVANNLHSPTIKELFRDMMNQTVRAFEQMVKDEIKSGLFRDDVSVETMGFALYKVGLSIQEQLEFSGIINPKESIQNNTPVYQGKKQELLRVVDGYIRLVRPAFDKP